MVQGTNQDSSARGREIFSAPSISTPKGGGAIRGIGEKFAANPVTGTSTLSVPLATSPGRSGFGPSLSLSYDSGSGNGPFGFGWALSIPAITRKTEKGLPQYRDVEESDVYMLPGAEDLVPVLGLDERRLEDSTTVPGYIIHRYRPRIEGLFARIERWTHQATGEIHWRSITQDNVTTFYGRDNTSRIFDPSDPAPNHPTRIFSWLICQSYDDKGNAIVYQYAAEDDSEIDRTQANERNRVRTANRYLKRITYGNRVPNRNDANWKAFDPVQIHDWLFEVVFDYDEGHYEVLDPPLPDAGQHRFVRASASPERRWAVRPDPFSSHRSGFEVRAYRRCHRVMMFHHFDELGSEPCLVRSTEFDYADLGYPDDSEPVPVEAELAHQGSTRFASFIRSITQSGFVRDETQPVLERGGVTFVPYLKKSLPSLEFEYSKPSIQELVREVDAKGVENLPAGLDGTAYLWVDLDGEGLSGILTEQADTWFYKPNLGGGRFGALQTVASKPSLAALSAGRQQLLDLAGDGQVDLVDLTAPSPGFYERTRQADWETFRPFTSLPNISWDDPNVRFVDLNGDGHADVLISEHDVFTWHPSLAEEGFGPALQVQKPLDEERGPRLILADGTQSIYLADMCGDGLTDLVRIRNGEVCYWPNLGYGRFGAKVTMDDAPWFANPDQFDQQRVRLADIDGSGTNDIIYLGGDTVRLYFNQSGNRWSEARPLRHCPRPDNLAALMTADLLGNGTACLVWSSPLPGDARRPMRYIDLMGGQKPHLLIKATNNLGAESHVRYTASTTFYLKDKIEGRPWIAKLPFPVHVVDRIEIYDRVSRNRFVTRYAYHHGSFDGGEREFRGFGMVEQWDTEEFAALGASDHVLASNVDGRSHVPPVHTKTWFHTGIYLSRDTHHRGEYYREPSWRDDDVEPGKQLLADTVLPDGLSLEEEREACRALKGAMLRQEVYALDGTSKEPHPYIVSEQNFTIQRLQPRAGNRHGVFFTHPREALGYQYERNPADPRISHALTLEVDGFGNVLKSVAVGYGRREADLSLPLQTDRDKQTATLITYTENRITNAIDDPDDYRTGLPSATRTYELTGFTPADHATRFSFDEWVRDDFALLTGASDITYGESADLSRTQRRLIEHVRTRYRKNDLTDLLPPGTVESLALPGESYKLGLTPELARRLLVETGKLTEPGLNDILADEGRYVHSEGDASWWIPSGRVFFHADTNVDNPTATAALERLEARHHFFLPRKFADPFHQTATVDYVHDLLVAQTQDAAGNTVTALHDYRVLQPRLVTDPNRNRTEVKFDALGPVVGTAVMGKPLPAPAEGDALEGFEADLTEAVILDHLANPRTDPESILRRATSRMVYDLFAYQRTKDQPDPQPAVLYTLVRETHDSDPISARGLKIQHSFSYSDGFGREIQKKIQAEPGSVPMRDAAGKIIAGLDGRPEMTSHDVSPRWVGSGWAVFNNKGKPVRQYEPFFTDTHRFEFDARIGVSPVLFYDPLERIVVTLYPNHTYEKVIFDPWRHTTYDVNDTVAANGAETGDPRTDADIRGYVGEYFNTEPATWQTWHQERIVGTQGAREKSAAEKAARHANTPTTAHFDTLGRPFLTLAHNGFTQNGAPIEFPTRVNLDIEGNEREVRDAIVQAGDPQGRVVMRYDYDMLGNPIHQANMEAGERWMLNDVVGNPIRVWDSRGHEFRTAYDSLRRPTDSFVREGVGAELLVGRSVYGETRPNPEANNLRGKVFQLFDQAGSVTSDDYDFKGNLLRSERQLALSYKTTLDWPGVPLGADTYTSRARYDALNRPTEITAPDNSVIRPGYNDANLIERIEVNLQNAATPTAFVNDIDYNAKGQRVRVEYGNGVITAYEYDRLTFRLTHVETTRPVAEYPDDCPDPPPAGWPGCQVQNLDYVYDPAGSITHVHDAAQQSLYFRNKRVEPGAEYTYDPLYRLTEATGREHLGQMGTPHVHSHDDKARVGIDWSANDGNAMGTYVEQYYYDAVGNFLSMQHRGSDPTHPGWKRTYAYNEPSLIEPGKQSNRLSSSTVGTTIDTYSAGGDGYDAHGNMQRLPQLHIMRWDFKDQLQMTRRQAVSPEDEEGMQRQGERTYNVYDAAGQRVRKVTELATGQMKEERLYLGGFEIYRRHGVNPVVRETLHIIDGAQRIALVERRTQDNDGSPLQLVRYQFGNHLGSVCLELDDRAEIVSYEEYTPYGSTSYQAVRNQTNTLKRYRYTGKERDEESGLYYHGARHYAPWLGRWTSPDPLGTVDGTNLYAYVKSNPVTYLDRTGRQLGTGSWNRETKSDPPRPRTVTAEQQAEIDALQAEVLFGDFYTGEPTWTGTGINVVVGFVPYVGQAADARDTVAAAHTLYQDPSLWNLVWLGFAGIGWAPGLGDAIKGGVKIYRKTGSGAIQAADAVSDTARKLEPDEATRDILEKRAHSGDVDSTKKPIPAATPDPGPIKTGPFKSGETFERVAETSQGPLRFKASTRIEGTRLHLENITLYGVENEQLNIGVREMAMLKGQLEDMAAAQGFETVRLSAVKLKLNPKPPREAQIMDFELIIDLRKKQR
jgi:RHS repeat-associated protein